jgi:hypothetical protein
MKNVPECVTSIHFDIQQKTFYPNHEVYRELSVRWPFSGSSHFASTLFKPKMKSVKSFLLVRFVANWHDHYLKQ